MNSNESDPQGKSSNAFSHRIAFTGSGEFDDPISDDLLCGRRDAVFRVRHPSCLAQIVVPESLGDP
jgi:hypothetical protein